MNAPTIINKCLIHYIQYLKNLPACRENGVLNIIPFAQPAIQEATGAVVDHLLLIANLVRLVVEPAQRSGLRLDLLVDGLGHADQVVQLIIDIVQVSINFGVRTGEISQLLFVLGVVVQVDSIQQASRAAAS